MRKAMEHCKCPIFPFTSVHINSTLKYAVIHSWFCLVCGVIIGLVNTKSSPNVYVLYEKGSLHNISASNVHTAALKHFTTSEDSTIYLSWYPITE